MVLDESMRLFPPAWMIGRCAKRDDVIGRFSVRAGEFVLISPYVTHRHPSLWPNPEGFDPTRFAPETGPAHALPKFAYLPFGGGQRFCIGATFALMQATLMLATICQRCELDLVGGFEPEPFAMITLRPKRGGPMAVRFRGSN
jgi:cytochrome P450